MVTSIQATIEHRFGSGESECEGNLSESKRHRLIDLDLALHLRSIFIYNIQCVNTN